MKATLTKESSLMIYLMDLEKKSEGELLMKDLSLQGITLAREN